ncbi:hypothetical protein [Nonomuraea sp. NPDC050643]|uniref:hypothetical protein n=1 Tax=Nonomuraea sp. NPDC050643 TaxID=3155660 RepID=UPI0033F5278C
MLAGALLLPAVPASATTATTATAAKSAAVMDDPFSVFKVTLKAPKTAKAGGRLNYTISAINTGPYYADRWFLGGEFPKGVDLKRIRFRTSIADTECFLEGRAFYCFANQVMEKGDSVTMIFETKLSKKAKGVQKATLGIITYDVDQGAENMSKEELDRLGFPVRGYAKTAKTKIVR